MRKLIIGSFFALLFIAWGIRFYALNGTFYVHSQNERKIYSINEEVNIGNCISYSAIEQPDFTISVGNVRIVESDDYLQELNKTQEDFLGLSERYLELTINVKNNSDTMELLDLYGFPVIGSNWYTFYDPDATKYVNNFEGDSRVIIVGIDAGCNSKIKIAYRLFWSDFNSNQWKNLENQRMWLSVTMSPVEKQIELFS